LLLERYLFYFRGNRGVLFVLEECGW